MLKPFGRQEYEDDVIALWYVQLVSPNVSPSLSHYPAPKSQHRYDLLIIKAQP